MSKWIRETIVMVGGATFTYQGYEIHFDVTFDDTEDPDQAKVKIFNLTPETENAIEVGDEFVLMSGYQGNIGTLLEGIVTDCHSEVDGTERICEIEASDTSEEKLNKQITKAWGPGVTASEVAEYVIDEAGLEVGEISLKEDVEYEHGYCVDGKCREILKDVVCNDGLSKCQVYNRAVFCMKWEDSIDDLGITISKNTGMIGIPTRISGDHIIRSYEVECLLEYRLRAGMAVNVASQTANGLYLVKKGVHKSDRGNHTTKIEVHDFTGAGPGGQPITGGGDQAAIVDPVQEERPAPNQDTLDFIERWGGGLEDWSPGDSFTGGGDDGAGGGGGTFR